MYFFQIGSGRQFRGIFFLTCRGCTVSHSVFSDCFRAGKVTPFWPKGLLNIVHSKTQNFKKSFAILLSYLNAVVWRCVIRSSSMVFVYHLEANLESWHYLNLWANTATLFLCSTFLFTYIFIFGCTWSSLLLFSSCVWGLLSDVVCGLLTVLPSLGRAQALGTQTQVLQQRRASRYGSQAPEHRLSSRRARG